MSPPVVIFAIGNPSRGDDAIGPVIFEQLGNWLAQAGLAADFELIEDFQLQIEHALDLGGRDLALFIDAGERTAAPYFFRQAHPAAGITHTTHELPPEAVLQVYCQTEGRQPPPAFILCVRGEHFELGEALSPAAMAHVTAALGLLETLCRNPQAAAWKVLAGATD